MSDLDVIKEGVRRGQKAQKAVEQILAIQRATVPVTPSPRQELDHYLGSGQLRADVEHTGLSEAAVQLLIDIVGRYCAPRSNRRRR